MLDENYQTDIIAKGSVISFLGTIIHKCISYFYVILIANEIMPSMLGQFFLALTIIEFLQLISSLGANAGFVRYIPLFQSRNQLDKLKGIYSKGLIIPFGLSIIITFFILLNANNISSLFREPQLSPMLTLLIIPFPLSVLAMLLKSILRAHKNIKAFIMVNQIIPPLGKLLITFILFYLGCHFYGLISGYWLSILISGFFGLYLSHKYYRKCRFEKMNKDTEEFIKYSSYIMFQKFTFFFSASINIWVIAYFLTSEDVALYSVAYRNAVHIALLFSVVSITFAPVVAELFAQRKNYKLQKIYSLYSKFLFVGSGILMINFLISGKAILQIFGKDYVKAYPLLIILSLAYFFDSFAGLSGVILKLSKHYKYFLYDLIFVALLNVSMNIILIPRLGILGAGIATFFSVGVLRVLHLLQVKKFEKISPFSVVYLKYILLFLPLFAIVFFIKGYLVGLDVNNVIIVVTVFIISTVLGIFLFYKYGFNKEEIVVIKVVRNYIFSKSGLSSVR